MNHLVDVESLAEREGFVVTTVVKEDEDTHVYVVEQQGATRVLKTITRPALRPNLLRDIAYSALVATLSGFGALVERFTGAVVADTDHSPGSPVGAR